MIMYIAESWKEGVIHIMEEWQKMGSINPRDMDEEESEKIMFEVNHTHTTFTIDETGSIIEF